MKTFLIVFLALGVVLFSRAGMAVDCDNAETQMEINECVYTDYEEADTELNVVYKKLVATVEKNGDITAKELLVKAQRAWIPFRDAECEFDADAMRGGSGYNMLYYSCLAGKTRDRTAQLQAHLEQYNY